MTKALSTQTAETMSSREIADLYGKPHSDTLKKIRKLEIAYVEVFGNEGKFSCVEYTDAKGESRPEFLLNKSQALFVASRFDAVLHARVQKRWEELEMPRQKLPGSFSEALYLAARQAEEIEQLRLEAQENQPRIEFALATENSVSAISVGDYVKSISRKHSVLIGRNNFFAWLRHEKILTKGNRPYQHYVNNGWLEVKESTYETPDGTVPCFTTKVTGKGQVAIWKRFSKSPSAAFFIHKK